ncbi:MAG: hypothetical protein ACT4OS_05345 [Acidimicrobiales bacterium]
MNQVAVRQGPGSDASCDSRTDAGGQGQRSAAEFPPPRWVVERRAFLAAQAGNHRSWRRWSNWVATGAVPATGPTVR